MSAFTSDDQQSMINRIAAFIKPWEGFFSMQTKSAQLLHQLHDCVGLDAPGQNSL